MTRHALCTPRSPLCLLVPAVLGSGAARPRSCARRPLPWLGRISYGIYLYHLTVLVAARALGPGRASRTTCHPYLLWAAAAVAAIGRSVAWVSWRLVEEPAMRLRSLGGPLLRRSPAERARAG